MDTMWQHLQKRNLNSNLHTVWVNEEEGVATFPLFNLSGQLKGYQQYRPEQFKDQRNDPKGKYWTFIPEPGVRLWGFESWSLTDTLFLVEGIFDAAKITYLGFSALAALSNDVDINTKNFLQLTRRYRKVVAICDSDNSGLKLAKHAHKYFQLQDFKDVGDSPTEYILDLLHALK